MKGCRFYVKAFLTVFCFTFITFVLIHQTAAAGDEKFEKYRQTIKKECGLDIKYFKDSMRGGRADGKKITKYDLNQLVMGIRQEQEHTKNKMVALEIAMDHLEKIPDYYTRLAKLEEDAANYFRINR